VARGGEESDAAEAGFRGGLGELREFAGGVDGERIRGGGGEFVLVYKLVGEAGDADGVIGSLATNDQQVRVVSDGVLEVAAITATPADAAALGEEGDEANGAARDVWPIERGGRD